MRRGWPNKRIEDVCQVNPREGKGGLPPAKSEVSFVPMSAIDEVTGSIRAAEVRRCRDVSKGYTSFRENDILLAKITPCMQNGKAAIARKLIGGFGFGSTEFHVLRPGPEVLPEWIFAFVRQPSFRAAAGASFTGTAGQQRVPTNFVSRSLIPIPPIPQQERIVAILDATEELRSLRMQADRRTADLIPALFHKMFGNPDKNTKEWPAIKLAQVTELTSGGTPSKENPSYWNGAIPWLSAKDMKGSEAYDAEDHVTELALKKTTLKRIPANQILIVVRGMILAHTLPLCITRVPVTINQDLKAIMPDENILDSDYLLWTLKALCPVLLAKVSDAGHGTKKLDVPRLIETPVPIPPLPLQRDFAARVAAIRTMEVRQAASRHRLDDLFQSLLHRAFRGEL